MWFWLEEQNSEFPKTFFGGYLFVFVEYLSKRIPKIKTKNIKNYSSILAIVNHRNWPDDSPPIKFKNCSSVSIRTAVFWCYRLYRSKKSAVRTRLLGSRELCCENIAQSYCSLVGNGPCSSLLS